MLWIYSIVVLLAALLIASWYFIPAVRRKMETWTTVAEGAIGVVLYAFGQFSDALREAQQAGYLPTQWLAYVPYVLLAWMILKRFTTKAPVGDKNTAAEVKLDRAEAKLR